VTLDISDRIAFLKKIHLFRGLDDAQLTAVADKLKEPSYKAGDVVFKQGDETYDFFLIYSGTVRVMQKKRNKERQLAILVPEDYFGEEALFSHKHRTATIYAQTDLLLFVLSREDSIALLKQIRNLKPNFEVAISSRRLARQLQFTWLQTDEVIYFLARKHPVLLWQAMILPALVFIIPIGFSVAFLLEKANSLVYIAIATFLLNIAWIIWRVVDWGNDYYIVTNLRVIWLEKIIGLYDSRQEAPLSTILSVGVETDQAGRILDYGDVIVRTFVGRIAFYHVSRPYQAASLIEEHWIRTKSASQRADVQALKRSIRQRLGLPVEEEGKSSASSPAPKVVMNKAQKLKDFFDRVNIFKVRFEDKGGTITYRKHWIVLFFQTWLPGVLFLVTLGLTVYQVHQLQKPVASALAGTRMDPLLSILIIVLIAAFLWWVYQYWDWSNDIFQVTLDQIFDIDRKPLGREEKKSAALDNILSTEAKRRGLLQIIFNYGDVYISIGNTRMDFFDVYNPSGVQQDIDRRRMARIERKNQAEVLAERERMADFFAMYHQSTQELSRDQEAQGADGIQNPQSPEQTDIH
jgi:ribosomal silencing factor RsfS